MKHDNKHFESKLRLRKALLKPVTDPLVVLETNGGTGHLYPKLYARAEFGCVIEKDRRKAEFLARQRPTWAVYQGDNVSLLANGLLADVPFNVIDVDPWGMPFDTLEALFIHPRRFADRVAVAVMDGGRIKVQLGGAWQVGVFQEAVIHFGNNLYPIYLDVCAWWIERQAAQAGYRLSRFEGFYDDKMTLYAFTLARCAKATEADESRKS